MSEKSNSSEAPKWFQICYLGAIAFTIASNIGVKDSSEGAQESMPTDVIDIREGQLLETQKANVSKPQTENPPQPD